MKKVFRSFEEMMAFVRGKVEEIEPEEYVETASDAVSEEGFQPENGSGEELQPKKKKSRKKGKEDA